MEENRKRKSWVSLQAGHLLLENGAEISRVKKPWTGSATIMVSVPEMHLCFPMVYLQR